MNGQKNIKKKKKRKIQFMPQRKHIVSPL